MWAETNGCSSTDSSFTSSMRSPDWRRPSLTAAPRGRIFLTKIGPGPCTEESLVTTVNPRPSEPGHTWKTQSRTATVQPRVLYLSSVGFEYKNLNLSSHSCYKLLLKASMQSSPQYISYFLLQLLIFVSLFRVINFSTTNFSPRKAAIGCQKSH